jgi:DNA modification methylase
MKFWEEIDTTNKYKKLFDLNLERLPKRIDDTGNIVDDTSMIGRLGFLPSSLWKPDPTITKELKEIINDTAQVRPSLNSNRSDRRHGVNGGKASVFNPHLTQMIISAYCPLGARIYDPFGGGGTRGYMATKMGHKYHGVEIREEEVERIKNQMVDWGISFDIVLGDSAEYKPTEKFNFALTCPPYYDLELYSELDNDLSNAGSYDDFLSMYKKVIQNVYDCLEDNSFAVFVVGNFRDETGKLVHFNGDTIRIAEEIGFVLWDEIIWQGASNVALTRVGKFEVNRKSVRMHEYVIILKKVS